LSLTSRAWLDKLSAAAGLESFAVNKTKLKLTRKRVTGTDPVAHRCKNVQIKIKHVKKRLKNVPKVKKTSVNVIKKRYLFLV